MDKLQRVIRTMKAAKAPISKAVICKRTRLKSTDVAEVLNHLSTLGRLEIECDPIVGNWAGTKSGHDGIELRYSLKGDV